MGRRRIPAFAAWALALAANLVLGAIENPILDGWYADPQIRRYGDEYWVFPTFSGNRNSGEKPFFDVFSSPDLRHWTKHAKALRIEDIPWAYSALWAPDAQEKDGKYYIFFSANDTYPADGSRTGTVVRAFGDRKYGGIGVAVSDRPEGPYQDLIGKPLIDQFWNGAQPIDQYVFEYKDEWYMLYGGWGRCNLVKLAPDFKSLLPLEDGAMWRDMTPPDYVEGSVMFERRGKWYFMYSSGSWTKDNYRVNYCVGESPFGPFEFKGMVLSSQRPIATGAGHNSVICIPGTDEWYICYHRRPIPNLSGKHRVTCLDRMFFDENGDILPIVMTERLATSAPIANVDFERGEEGWRLKPAYSVQAGAGMNGSSGLVYENADPDLPYAFPTAPVELKAGETYRFAAWVRTENLVPSKGAGAAIAIEWSDAEGHHLGGSYSQGLKGSHDWTHIVGVTPPLPEKAANFTFVAYCTPGSVGKAFFDDIEIAPLEKAPVGPMLSSAYRNTAAEGRIAFCVGLAVPEKFAIGELEAEFSFVSADGARKTAVPETLTRDEASFSLDIAELMPGRSEVFFSLRAPDGAPLGTTSLSFNRVTSLPQRRVWIDDHRRTIVDGKPFFPLGMYTGSASRREDYVKGPFNCIMPYSAPDRDGMDFYWTNGVMVVYSVKDIYAGATRAPASVTDEATADAFVQAKVDAFKDHPGLLAWYVNDELVGEGWFGPLARRRDFLERTDPDHPTWAVVYQLQFLRDLTPTFDVIGTDPYPVPNKPLSMAADWTRTTDRAFFGLRPLWQVPQAFDWGGYRPEWPGSPENRMPTVDEMRSMSWQCIAEGANGLFFYSFAALQKETHGLPFEMAWTDVCSVGEEIRKFFPVLLSVDPTPTVSGVPGGWSVRVWRNNGETWLLVVNAQDKAAEATLLLSEDFSAIRAAFGPEAEKTGPRSLKVSLAPNQPAFYSMR